MELLEQGLSWLFDVNNWQGDGSIPQRLTEHMYYSVLALVLAAVFAIPLGYLIGHTGRGRILVVAIGGASRALPSFGLILALVLLLGINQRVFAAALALSLLAFAPLLSGAFASLEAIDPETTTAARAQGMGEWQIFFKVELPLSLTILFGAIRNATLQVIATATLVAYVGLGGLGYEIIQGIPLRRYDQMIGAAILVASLAIVSDLILSFVQRKVTPAGVSERLARQNHSPS